MSPGEESRAISRLVERLGERFPDVARETIRDAVGDAHRGLDGAPIRDFVPVLVEHEAMGVLKARAARGSSLGATANA
jgi:hypothetical protein